MAKKVCKEPVEDERRPDNRYFDINLTPQEPEVVKFSITDMKLFRLKPSRYLDGSIMAVDRNFIEQYNKNDQK